MNYGYSMKTLKFFYSVGSIFYPNKWLGSVKYLRNIIPKVIPPIPKINSRPWKELNFKILIFCN
jgi:hypothetical protein